MGSKHASSPSAQASSRGCGGIRWKRIFQYQTHGGWVVLIAALIVLAVSHYTVTPEHRQLSLYDATVSYPNQADTVSIELAGAIPAVALILTVAAVEFGAMHKKQSLTMAVHAFFHIIWWAIIGFAVVLSITEATKPWASRYRPDYLSRCKPVNAQDGKTTLTYRLQTDCDRMAKETDFAKDGRKSFPSGHSSNSMSLCWFTILYLVHALYWREGLSYLGRINGNRGWARRLLGEVLQGLFILWGLVVVSIAWCIGVTRFRDNRHNIDDILGGFMAALLWMTPCVFIALGQLTFYQQRLRREEGDTLLMDSALASTTGSTGAAYSGKEPLSTALTTDAHTTTPHGTNGSAGHTVLDMSPSTSASKGGAAAATTATTSARLNTLTSTLHNNVLPGAAEEGAHGLGSKVTH